MARRSRIDRGGEASGCSWSRATKTLPARDDVSEDIAALVRTMLLANGAGCGLLVIDGSQHPGVICAEASPELQQGMAWQLNADAIAAAAGANAARTNMRAR
ncbi:MAG TPA: hypothetical protein VMS98_19435 [Thermoanaerobaculia bacterium]|nr:hypothetical protein [Thermoanaerobaculia bacterium]